jgi:hypothetical protein
MECEACRAANVYVGLDSSHQHGDTCSGHERAIRCSAPTSTFA